MLVELRNANDGKAFTKILDELKKAGKYGYTVNPHLYKFEEYGIPQARHRIIIVGIRNDINVSYRVPSPAPYADIDNTCRKAIEEPPIPSDALNNELTRDLLLLSADWSIFFLDRTLLRLIFQKNLN